MSHEMEVLTRAIDSGCQRVDLFPEDLRSEFGDCETRITLVKSWVGKYYIQEIFYKGCWRKVGHTSLYDDVATGFCAPNIESTMTMASLLSGMVYGARVHDDYVSIITHMTDG
jgi:hypothetical protein